MSASLLVNAGKDPVAGLTRKKNRLEKRRERLVRKQRKYRTKPGAFMAIWDLIQQVDADITLVAKEIEAAMSARRKDFLDKPGDYNFPSRKHTHERSILNQRYVSSATGMESDLVVDLPRPAKHVSRNVEFSENLHHCNDASYSYFKDLVELTVRALFPSAAGDVIDDIRTKWFVGFERMRAVVTHYTDPSCSWPSPYELEFTSGGKGLCGKEFYFDDPSLLGVPYVFEANPKSNSLEMHYTPLRTPVWQNFTVHLELSVVMIETPEIRRTLRFETDKDKIKESTEKLKDDLKKFKKMR